MFVLIVAVATAILLALKLAALTAVSWWVVFSPVLVYLGIVAVILLSCLVVLVGIGLKDYLDSKKRK